MPIMFESPFVDKKVSHTDNCVPPLSSLNQLSTIDPGSLNKLRQSQGDYLPAKIQPMKKKKRKVEKFSPIDNEIGLSRREMKAGTSNDKVLTRQVDLRAREVKEVLIVQLKLFKCHIFNSDHNYTNPRIYYSRCTLNQVGNN